MTISFRSRKQKRYREPEVVSWTGTEWFWQITSSHIPSRLKTTVTMIRLKRKIKSSMRQLRKWSVLLNRMEILLSMISKLFSMIMENMLIPWQARCSVCGSLRMCLEKQPLISSVTSRRHTVRQIWCIISVQMRPMVMDWTNRSCPKKKSWSW